MNANEFVLTLERLAESAHVESPDERSMLRAVFRCPRREPERKALVHPLADLVWRYECTNAELGHIRLVSAPRPHWAGQVVGFWEGELLVAEDDGKVGIFEHERFGERLQSCAGDGASFLDALATFLGMVLERHLWLERSADATRLCAQRAGGPQFEDFYLGMLSYLEYGVVAATGA